MKMQKRDKKIAALIVLCLVFIVLEIILTIIGQPMHPSLTWIKITDGIPKDAKINSAREVTALSSDAWLEFQNIDQYLSSISFSIKGTKNNATGKAYFLYAGSLNYSEEDSASFSIPLESDGYIQLPVKEYRRLRRIRLDFSDIEGDTVSINSDIVIVPANNDKRFRNIRYVLYSIVLIFVSSILFVWRKVIDKIQALHKKEISEWIRPKNIRLIKYIGIVGIVILALCLLLPSMAACRHQLKTISLYLNVMRLLIGGCLLSALGMILLRLLGGLWLKRDSFFHGLVLSQIFLVPYFLLRSVINHKIGFTLPVGVFDVVISLLVLFFWAYRKNKKIVSEMKVYLTSFDFFLSLASFFIVVFMLAYKELPRELMLSSDPDNHAFWLEQCRRLRSFPFTQGEWGADGVNYPTGFTLLNYAWLCVSGIDPRDIVTIQPLLQFFLAVFLALESINPQGSHARKSIAFLGAIVLIFLCFPQSYQQQYFHLEGTARISSACSIALLISLILTLRRSKDRISASVPVLYVFSLNLVLAILINPVHGSVTGLMSLITLILYLMEYKPTSRFLISLPLILLGIGLLVASDPYFSRTIHQLVFDHLNASEASTVIASSLVSKSGNTLNVWIENIHSAFAGVDFKHILQYVASTFYLPNATYLIILILLCLLLIIRKWKGGSSAILFAIVGITLLCLSIVLYIFLPLISGFTLDYLFLPYIMQSWSMIWDLWIIVSILLIWVRIIEFIGSIGAIFLIAATCACLMLVGTLKGTYSYASRCYYSGSMGSITQQERSVIGKIEALAKEFRYTNPKETAPRILILNYMLQTPNEKWLFPMGGSRLLPFIDCFPVAFFYTNGDKDFSYDTYRARVVDLFDLEWLAYKRIRYIYLNLEYLGFYGEINIKKIMDHVKLVFNDGPVYFLEIVNGQ